MWDLPGPGLEPVSPALEGGFLTTVPPGKSQKFKLFNMISKALHDQLLFSQESVMVRLGSKTGWVQIPALPFLVAV